MKVLVTGAKGFVGRNLCESLKNIRDGKDRQSRYRTLLPLEVYEFDTDSTYRQLDEWCAKADFVFNLAGVNRPQDSIEYMAGNFGFASDLLTALEEHGNRCPVMLASSIQASLTGRFANSEYGKSKLAGERLFREYSKRTGAKTLIYRFPNLYGKWCRPNYNSVVATFCNNIANGLPIKVNDSSTVLELLYIDDLVEEMLSALLGEEHSDGDYCVAGPTDKVTLGEIVVMLESFRDARETLAIPDETKNSFSKKLHATYLSYIDSQGFSYRLKSNKDERGSFTEFLRTPERGQLSINVSKPGVTKGNHWHHTKWEKFLVVSGEALIKLRRIGNDAEGNLYPVVEYCVSGDNPTVVEMAPGYAHSIENRSCIHDLVTVMWASEPFDSTHPDTYAEEVQ